MNQEKEEWRTIVGFSDYEISNYGRIKSLERTSRSGRKLKEIIMKQRLDKENRFSCNLVSDEGKPYRKYAHVEMAKAFLDDYKQDDEVSTIDGNPFNLTPDNLFLENRIDKRKRNFNSEHMKNKVPIHLSKKQKEVIRKKIEEGFSNSQIAVQEKVKRQQVSRIRSKIEKEESSR